MHERIRKAREELGYTREAFAEQLDVSVSFLAEVERGLSGISVKMLIRICNVLDLSADYILFGNDLYANARLLDKIHRIDEKYLPLVEKLIATLLPICGKPKE